MGRRYHVDLGSGEPTIVEVLEDDGTRATVRIGDGDDAREIRIALNDLPGQRVLCVADMGSQVLDVRDTADGQMWLVGSRAEALVRVVDERDTWLGSGGAGAGDSIISVAMPGRVVAIDVEEGTAVERGQRILVIEAMKMENDVKAPRDGIVRAVRVAAGDAVDAGQPLLELE